MNKFLEQSPHKFLEELLGAFLGEVSRGILGGTAGLISEGISSEIFFCGGIPKEISGIIRKEIPERVPSDTSVAVSRRILY